ncbi:hypothetical protein CDV36_006531 [Fusarium kuroshium]|uniref:Protein kinase domain-containing protein n=1 Tax=Fusarium kuroshium TaxID=2010991 RepID=A0A3M2S8A7_9HYPO|nr:hypothetical protein CDV36_006531 [Fusarium kuroshium]
MSPHYESRGQGGNASLDRSAPPPSRLPLSFRVNKGFQKISFPPEAQPVYFLPKNAISELVDRDVIIQELWEHEQNTRDEDESLVQWIQNDAPQFFLTMVESRAPDITSCSQKCMFMKLFQRHGFSDKHLPLPDLVNFQHTPSTSDQQEICQDVWGPVVEYFFKQAQWKFVVPVISKERFRYLLQPEQILPFIEVDDVVKEGAFGRVYRVKIHPSHIDHHTRELAVKEIIISGGKEAQKAIKDAWPNEVRALEIIKDRQNAHLIHCIAAIERDRSRYLLFPWAQGGNLKEYWETNSPHGLEGGNITEALIQLKGLAGALCQLHYFSHARDGDDPTDSTMEDSSDSDGNGIMGEYGHMTQDGSIRHGDLKPENLLWFLDDKGSRWLKIADLGLAKRHVIATQDRSKATSTRYGTILYEAPEAQTAVGNQPRSRQYDIWSMGCIALEWIIWILYGNEELRRFYENLKGSGRDYGPYYTLSSSGQGPTLHQAVDHWIKFIRGKHPICQRDSAINDLLKLVEERLLVVQLPPRRPTTLQGRRAGGSQSDLPSMMPGGTVAYRATSKDLEKAIQNILNKVQISDEYLLTSRDLESTPHVPDFKPGLHPGASRHGATRSQPRDLAAPTSTTRLEGWEFPVDNEFAQQLVRSIGLDNLMPSSSTSAKLCNRCMNLDFGNSSFYLEESSDKLIDSSKSCELCELFYDTWSGAFEPEKRGTLVRLERTDSVIKAIGPQALPILSMLTLPRDLTSTSEFQIGLPELPQPGSDQFFQIIRHWLQDCDENHGDCQLTHEPRLPTRLIDLGSLEYPILRLVETLHGEVAPNSQYIALSHRWGDTSKHRPFCTRLKDTSGRGHDLECFKKLIPFDQVPQTFRDAIETTRRLGVRYLWIDSLCIIQGDDGDFGTEAKRMEDVFSCAYCVIAASRASNQLEGFLGKRPERKFLATRQGALAGGHGNTIYICEGIDDFGHHVLNGDLNRRGWVLQERALARRTVYFADMQTYFECGQGVRCETLARTKNRSEDLLGDAKFPNRALRTTSRGLKIRYFQDLYRRYSRLEFSHIQDRPVAIAGLENRLRGAYCKQGGFGIFDDGPGHGLLHRSLLWQRSTDEDGQEAMELIDFSEHPKRAPPTWSWMAFKGAIDYIDPPFQKVEWEKREVEPPWSVTAGGSDKSHNSRHLKVVAREFNVARRQPGEVDLVYDTPERKPSSDGQRPMCVVVAREKGGKSAMEKRYYVLLVSGTPEMASSSQKVFTRLGVGSMLGKYIELEQNGQAGVVR